MNKIFIFGRIEMMLQFHSKKYKDVLKEFSSNLDGLENATAKERLLRFGYNEIPEKKESPLFLIFLKQFQSGIIYILLGAAIFSFFTGHFFDVYIILTVLLINALMGSVQEYRAEKAILSLKKIMVPFAKVIRRGELAKIPSRELVPGDIILLHEGDMVPADARLIEARNFKTIESALTGESFPAEKQTKELPFNTPLSDQSNMVWLGTFVASGEAKAVVCATGLSTSLGQVAETLKEIEPPKTHFKVKTDTLAKQMVFMALSGSFLIFTISHWLRNIPLGDAFRFTVSALVSGIPEGLPVVLVIVLAVGAHRMAKRNAIVRNLQATEALSVVNVIATDKTGTITQGVMSVRKIVLPSRTSKEQAEFEVTGEGWEPKGEFIEKSRVFIPLERPQLKRFLHIAAIANNAHLIKEGEREKYSIIGDPTEGAFVVLAEKAGIKKDILEETEKKIDDLPFNQELKYRASLVHDVSDNTRKIYIIGAPESLLNLALKVLKDKEENISSHEKKLLLKKAETLAEKGFRVLALSYQNVPNDVKKINFSLIRNVVFVGMAALKDPPRPEVKEAIELTKNAGIKVIMKTGDHKKTAIAIAKEVGLLGDDDDVSLKVLEQKELELLSKDDFKKAVNRALVFARLTPQMKLKILETLQSEGKIVAMTGDGINDALALKRSDVGIAMGKMGTDVAKEGGDIVLTDDNFASIVHAIEEARTVFNNIKRVSLFLITTNFGEMMTLAISLFFGIYFWGETLLIIFPATILFLNLVTDGFAVTPLALEPPHERLLNMPPRKKEENILSKNDLPFLVIVSFFMVFCTLLVFKFFLVNTGSVEKARAAAFAILALSQDFNMLNMRSLSQSIFKVGFFTNKFVVFGFLSSLALISLSLFHPTIASKFGFEPLNILEFLVLMLISSLVLWAGEIYKRFKIFLVRTKK